MKEVLNQLMLEEYAQVEKFITKELGISKELINECGEAPYRIEMYSDDPSQEVNLLTARRDFETLCNACTRDQYTLRMSFMLLTIIGIEVKASNVDGKKLLNSLMDFRLLRGILIGKIRPDLTTVDSDVWKKVLFESKVDRSEFARSGAKKRHQLDPKQSIKQSVKECWDMWQEDPQRYKGKAAFARDMMSKYEELQSADVISRWCRSWYSETLQAK